MVYNKYEAALATSGCRGLVPTTNQSPADATAWLKLHDCEFFDKLHPLRLRSPQMGLAI